MSIEFENGQLSWIPKIVIYKGKEYPAPLNLLPIITMDIMMEILLERKTK